MLRVQTSTTIHYPLLYNVSGAVQRGENEEEDYTRVGHIHIHGYKIKGTCTCRIQGSKMLTADSHFCSQYCIIPAVVLSN